MEHQYCTFFLDGQCFGVDVLKVQEVLRFQEMTRVPLAPSHISGLINLRGQIVTAIDLRPSLSMAARPSGERPTIVIIKTADGPVSLLVDAIGDVLKIPGDSIEPPPDNIKGTAGRLLGGVCQLKDKLMLILDTEKALDEVASRLPR
jgi:purine-binding chemotaxis protein CheW